MTISKRFDEASVKELRSRVRGPIVQPGDADYDEARKVYNAMHDRRPALIVRATGVADVIAAVTFAAHHGAVLAVRAVAATASPATAPVTTESSSTFED